MHKVSLLVSRSYNISHVFVKFHWGAGISLFHQVGAISVDVMAVILRIEVVEEKTIIPQVVPIPNVPLTRSKKQLLIPITFSVKRKMRSFTISTVQVFIPFLSYPYFKRVRANSQTGFKSFPTLSWVWYSPTLSQLYPWFILIFHNIWIFSGESQEWVFWLPLFGLNYKFKICIKNDSSCDK